MNKVKAFLANKKIGFYVSAVAFLLALICLIAYTARGGNYLSPVNGVAVTFLVLGLLANCVTLISDFSILGILPVIFYSITFAILFNSEMLFFTNVLFGVDGNVIDGAWVLFFITIILAILSSAVGFAMGISKSNKLLAEDK